MMKKQPIIIVAPHSFTKIPKKFRDRVKLSDFELWQMSDPFTDETCLYPQAFSIHKAKTHRLLGDLNRDETAEDLFRIQDFYLRETWKKDQGLAKREKKDFVEKLWRPFRAEIKKSFEAAKKAGFKKILFIDHHNTATDHPANHGHYLPPINLGNFGDGRGNFDKIKLSASSEVMNHFKVFLKNALPEVLIEMNKVYKGSSLVRYVRDEISPQFPDLEIHSINLEYNLNLIFNPLSRKVDKIAKDRLHKGINDALGKLMKEYFI